MARRLRKYKIGETYESAFWGRDDLDFDEYSGNPDEPEDEEIEEYETMVCEHCFRTVTAHYASDQLCYECFYGVEEDGDEWVL